jgi:hypothetical protein
MTWGDIRFALSSAFPEADIPLLDAWISLAYASVLERIRWRSLNGTFAFAARGAYRTGSVSVTSGSTDVTGSGTSWDSGQTGWKIKIGNDNATYGVSISDGTHLVLDRAYLGETASGLGYVLFQDTYAMSPDFKYVKDVWVDTYGKRLVKADPRIQARADNLVVLGTPSYWWHGDDLLNESLESVRSIVLYPAPERDLTIRVSYDGAAPAYRGDNLNESPPSWIPGEAILALAEVYGYTRAGNTAAATACRQTADEIMAGLIRHESHRSGPARLIRDPAISAWRRGRVYR